MFDPFDLDSDDDATGSPRLHVSLRIRGDELDPDFLTQQLGVLPTGSARGEGHGTGIWSYRPEVPAGTELGDAIDMLLAPLPDDTVLWSELASTYTIDVRCELFLLAEEQVTTIAPEVFERLGRLGFTLHFDLHGPGHAARDGRS